MSRRAEQAACHLLTTRMDIAALVASVADDGVPEGTDEKLWFCLETLAVLRDVWPEVYAALVGDVPDETIEAVDRHLVGEVRRFLCLKTIEDLVRKSLGNRPEKGEQI
jgi:hypothetical protein